jgi:thiol:disulfide interchange protein
MQFTVKTILAIIALAAVGSLAVRNYLDRLPLELEPYSMNARNGALKNGQCVLVTIYGNWDPNTTDNLRRLSHDVNRRIRRRNMLPLAADWTNHASHITALMKEVGVNSVPVLAFYDPRNPTKPTVVRDFPDEVEVLAIIDSCCN